MAKPARTSSKPKKPLSCPHCGQDLEDLFFAEAARLEREKAPMSCPTCGEDMYIVRGPRAVRRNAANRQTSS